MGTSFGEIKVDEVKPEGWYSGHVVGVVEMETQFGPSALWSFILEDGQEVTGFSSLSKSSRGKLAKWSCAVLGTNIEGLIKSGKGTDDLSGYPVGVFLDIATQTRDGQEFEINKVTKLRHVEGGEQRDVSYERDELISRIEEANFNREKQPRENLAGGQAANRQGSQGSEDDSEEDFDKIPF